MKKNVTYAQKLSNFKTGFIMLSMLLICSLVYLGLMCDKAMRLERVIKAKNSEITELEVKNSLLKEKIKQKSMVSFQESDTLVYNRLDDQIFLIRLNK